MITALNRLLPARLRRRIEASVHRFIVTHGYVPFDVARHYAEDGLFTLSDQSFREEAAFREAYARGVRAGYGVDAHFEWRIHVALWAADTALRAHGDFVECGVNAGFVSSAIMHRLNWSAVPRRYHLVDTFAGPIVEQYSAAEVKSGMAEMVKATEDAGAYVTDIERVRANFAEWPNAVIVQGAVPDILPAIRAERVAFLHLDMNCALPERAALEYFWPRMSPGAIVLMDDYAYWKHGDQKKALDAAARSFGVEALALPTGQGLIVR